jgi:hypothetical protein
MPRVCEIVRITRARTFSSSPTIRSISSSLSATGESPEVAEVAMRSAMTTLRSHARGAAAKSASG